MSISSFWMIQSIFANRQKLLAQVNANSEQELKEKYLKELKKLKEENEKLKQPERSKREDFSAKQQRCYHSYHQNQSGWWELQRYGCKCNKDAVL